MVHGKNRIPYWIDRRLSGLAGPDYDATISFGLPIEPEDSQYGESRLGLLSTTTLTIAAGETKSNAAENYALNSYYTVQYEIGSLSDWQPKRQTVPIG